MRTARTTTYLLVIGLLTSLLLAGALALTACGSGSANTGTSSGNPALAGAQPFVVSAIPRDDTGGTETKVGDVTQTRNGTASYDVEATDPRLSGTFDVVYNTDEASDGTLTKFYGTWKATNDKGTWECDNWSGAQDSAGHLFTVGVGRGTGDYEGLVAVWQWYWPLNTSSFSTALPVLAVSGWVQKAP